MKRWIATTLLLLTPFPALAAEPQPSPAPLTLTDALSQALTSNPRLEEARAAVARARGEKRGARAEGRPSLDASAGQVFQGPSQSGPIKVNSTHQFEANLDLTVPIDSNGRIKAGKRGAAQAEKAALARAEGEAQRLVLDVTEAYLNAGQALQETTLVSELRRLNEERLRVARVRLTAGVAAPLEVSQTEADYADAVQREIEAQSRLRQVSATLNTLIGRPAAAPLVLATDQRGSEGVRERGSEGGNTAGSTPNAQGPRPNAQRPTLPTLEAATPEEARSIGLARPDLRAMRADVGQADAGVDAARAARRPLAGISGNLVKRSPATFLGSWAWSLGASLAQSIFDGGRSRARVEQARADRARAGAALAEAERRADEQVEQSRVGLDAAEKRLAAEDQRVIAARDALDVARKRHAAGIAPALEVTEAETVLTRARTDALTARFEAARSRVRLAYAAGLAYPETVR
jgi:multidrug efflux system outer membrane protein